MQVRVAAEGRRDVPERTAEYSENGRINTKTHRCHFASDTSVSTCLWVCVEYWNSAVYLQYENM